MKYEALFEDEADIFGGTPQSKYWDIVSQMSDDNVRYEFDRLMEKMAAMERMLMQYHDEEMLDRVIETYCAENPDDVELHKKSLYMELAGDLIFKIAD